MTLSVVPKPRVYIHEAVPPFRRVAELTSAADIDRGWKFMEAVDATYTVATTDPAFAVFSVGDLLHPGNMVVIESWGLPPWVGFIADATWTLRSRVISIKAKDAITLLAEREIRPLNAVSAAGRIFLDLVSTANARNPTGIMHAHPDVGPAVKVDFGSGNVLDALKELSEISGQEWWLEADVRPSGVRLILHWATLCGQDRSKTVIYREGDPVLADAKYIQTDAGIVASSAAVGAPTAGGTFSTRNIARVTLLPSGLGSHSQEVLTQASPAQQQRLAPWLTPATSREVVVVRNAISEVITLTQRASATIDHQYRGPEQIEALLALSEAPLMGVGMGDVVAVEAQNLGPQGIRKSFRITEIKPDDAAGTVTLSGPCDGGLGLRGGMVRRVLGIQDGVQDLQLK